MMTDNEPDLESIKRQAKDYATAVNRPLYSFDLAAFAIKVIESIKENKDVPTARN